MDHWLRQYGVLQDSCDVGAYSLKQGYSPPHMELHRRPMEGENLEDFGHVLNTGGVARTLQSVVGFAHAVA